MAGNHFVDGNGTTIRLLGVNRSGSEYMCTGGGNNVFDGPSDDTSIAAMASWHINAVRLGLNEDCWLGINGLPISPLTASAYQAAIVDYVNRLHLQGIYAILELHWNAPGTNKSLGQQVMVDADHGSAFWTSVATTFKGDSRTLFDLYNEPEGISWTCLLNGCMAGFQTVGMQSLVNTVRATGATNPLLIGGIGYAGDLSQWLTVKPTDPDKAIVASFHTYDFVGNCTSLSCASTLLAIAATTPVVTGELGETDCAHGYIDAYMPWADANGISYLGWAWDTYGCSFPSLINAYDGTPSTFGIGFRNHLAALVSSTAPAVTSVTPGSGPMAGGTAVTISGTNLGSATAVHFGSAAATILTDSASSITTTSPAASGTGSLDVTVTTAGGTSAATAADHFTYTSPAAYTAVAPVRLMDTRLGGGALGAGASRNLTVAGVAGVPGAASAVVVNVTVTDTTAPSFLTVYPAGATRPLASNLNYMAGTTIPNLVSVQVGSGGAITFFNAAGSADVVVDLEGYYAAPSGSAGGEVALAPARITDTRANSGQPDAGRTLGGGGSLDVQVSGAGEVPSIGVSAVILNVTVTNTTAASFLTVWPAGATRPTASNLNWTAGQTIPNRVIVPLGVGGKISVFNSAGSADVIIDVSGYFTNGTASGKFFNAEAPIRLADTRISAQTLGPNGSFTLPVVGKAGVPSGATAVVLNVTVTNTTAPSWLVVYPSTGSRPLASDLDWVGGRTIPNLVVATLGTTGAITFFNSSGSTDVIVDIAGWYG